MRPTFVFSLEAACLRERGLLDIRTMGGLAETLRGACLPSAGIRG